MVRYTMEQEFHRIKRLPPYVFAEVNAMKAAARAAGEDIIDFGMGNPDQPTPPISSRNSSKRCRIRKPTVIPLRAELQALGRPLAPIRGGVSGSMWTRKPKPS